MAGMIPAHENKIKTIFVSHGGDGDFAEKIVAALLIRFPSTKEDVLTDSFRTQFRQILLNAKGIVNSIKQKTDITPEDVADMSPKDMATGTIKRKQQQLREEEIAYALLLSQSHQQRVIIKKPPTQDNNNSADTLDEEWSARCGKCGLRRMSMSNTNILCDLEDGESWRKLEAEDDFCYCEADPGEDISKLEEKETDKSKEKRPIDETTTDKRQQLES